MNPRTTPPSKRKTLTEEQEQKVDWKKYIVAGEVPDVKPLVTIQEKPIATAGNHSLITGRQKSRKTLFLIQWIRWYQEQNTESKSEDIIIFDTEQGKKHTRKMKSKIETATNRKCMMLELRGINYIERRQVIEQAVEDLKPKIIVIDGVRDLISDINNADQSTELIAWIESISTNKNIHIVNVLHLAKTTNEARGHIGSELLNKAEITIELERDEKANMSIVKCQSSREEPFEDFGLRHDPDGMPEVTDLPNKAGKLIEREDMRNKVKLIFEGREEMRTGELIEEIENYLNVKKRQAHKYANEMHANGWLFREKKSGNETTWKILI